MSYDWFLDFDVKDQNAINTCVDGKDTFDKINIYSRTKLLATCLNKSDIKNYAKSGDRIRHPKGHKLIILNKYNSLIQEEIDRLKALNLYKSSVEISTLPHYSFFIQFAFTLATPYISKDDEEFYICNNPIRKDKVFKVPMVSGSTWKGNMRWTAGRLLEMVTDINERFKKRIQISNLFGNENEAEERYFDSLMPGKRDDFKMRMRSSSNKEGLRRGRLNFYPTFFDRISLEVINPHNRKTKAGTVPIYIESVPKDAPGTFSLLYMPFDLMGKSSEEIKQPLTEDISLICDSLGKMMLTYGFSAKKSSGFGIINKDITGDIPEMSGCTHKEKLLAPKPTRGKTYTSFKELTSPNKKVSSFSEMRALIEQKKEEAMKNAK